VQQNSTGQTGPEAITASKLVKKFGSFKALDGLNLRVKTGEVHGFLGPNGSGKSTTIRILLGLLRKTGGEAVLLGGDPWRDAVPLHRRLAYVPGDVNLWPNLSGGEAIDLFARLRGDLDRKRRDELLDHFELDPTKKCRTYSKGNRQKVALVAAFASDVELYILDEPTSGLDPLMEAKFQQTVREIKDAGKTVLLSSHILAEVEALCDRVTIIREGRTVESGTLSELRHLTRTSVKVNTRKPIKGLRELPGLYDLILDKTHAEFEVDTDNIDQSLRLLLQFDIADIVTSPPTLADLFMRHYDDEIPESSDNSKQEQEKVTA
jgi:ABC-2 type transport system ATP-binding protein